MKCANKCMKINELRNTCESVPPAKGYRMERNISLQRSGTLRSCIEIATQLPLTRNLLDQQCQAAAAGRTFDLAFNNCQRFVTDVLIRLVNSGVISQAQYRQLAARGFAPLMGGPGMV